MAKRGSNIYKRKDGRFEGRVSVGYKKYIIDRIYWKNVKETFKNVISALTEREQKVIRLKYGLSLCGKHSVKEIADMFYVDKERIISIEEKALRKLKRNEEIRKLWEL